jgi:hypothetical protein
MANQVQLISHGLYAYGVIALPSMAASLSLGEIAWKVTWELHSCDLGRSNNHAGTQALLLGK